jgi:rod shape-determining protein MreD
MARLIYALIMVFAAIAQATFLPKIWPLEIQPDFTLVLLLVWCINTSTAEGLTWAFGLGILLDVLALDPLGTNALALLPVVLLAAVSRRQVFRNRLLAPIALMIAATILHAIALLLLRSNALGDTPLTTIARLVLLQSLLNSMLVPPLALFAGWLSGRSAGRSRSRRRTYTVRT